MVLLEIGLLLALRYIHPSMDIYTPAMGVCCRLLLRNAVNRIVGNYSIDWRK